MKGEVIAIVTPGEGGARITMNDERFPPLGRIVRFEEDWKNGQGALVPWITAHHADGSCVEFNVAHLERIERAPPEQKP